MTTDDYISKFAEYGIDWYLRNDVYSVSVTTDDGTYFKAVSKVSFKDALEMLDNFIREGMIEIMDSLMSHSLALSKVAMAMKDE